MALRFVQTGQDDGGATFRRMDLPTLPPGEGARRIEAAVGRRGVVALRSGVTVWGRIYRAGDGAGGYEVFDQHDGVLVRFYGAAVEEVWA